MNPMNPADAPSQVVILTGGRGTRMRPYTTIFPKPLLPVEDMPILEILIRQLAREGFAQISLASGYLSGLIQAYFGDGSRWGVSIDYTVEDEPLGTAGPLALVRGLTESFIVMNGDVLSTLSCRDLLTWHKDSGAIATVATCARDVQVSLGAIEVDERGDVASYIEKPKLGYLASMGIYAMHSDVLQFIPAGRRLDLPDVVSLLIDRGERVAVYRFSGYWRDLGQPMDYEQAIHEFPGIREEILGDRRTDR